MGRVETVDLYGVLAVQNPDGSWSSHHCLTSRFYCRILTMPSIETNPTFTPERHPPSR